MSILLQATKTDIHLKYLPDAFFAQILWKYVGKYIIGKMRKNLLFIALYCFLVTCFAQKSLDETAEAIHNIFLQADHAALGKMLAPNVYISAPAHNDQCSAPHATRILKEFFFDKPVKTFKVVQKGVFPDSNVTYISALYTTESMQFDIFIILKNDDEKKVINKLIIKEKQ